MVKSKLFKPAIPDNEPPPDTTYPAPSKGQSAIPDLLRVGAIPSNQSAMIDTDILEPVIFSESFIRFQLVNKGFLNPFSRITFQLDNVSASSASNLRSTLPLNIGVHALIQNATLKIGTKTICELADYNYYQAYKSIFESGETNKEREQYLSSRGVAHSQTYDRFTDTCNFIGLDNGKDYNESASGTATGLSCRDLQLVSNGGVFSITLEELFPLFKDRAFPLYMLNTDMPVQIELTLSSSEDGSRISTNGQTLNASTTRSNLNVPMTINRNECRLIADYTTYDGNLMTSYANANPSMTWTYMDYQLTKTSLSSVNALNQIRNVGGAGRLVPRMFVSISQGTNSSLVGNGTPYNRICNDYSSEANLETATAFGRLTSNIKKNDKFIFPIDRSNTALHFHGVMSTEGTVPSITRDEYSRCGGRMTTAFYELNQQNVGLSGKFFHTAYKMVDGDRVNSRGLELHSKMQALPPTLDGVAVSYTSRCWIECVKVATLIDGVFDCYYA